VETCKLQDVLMRKPPSQWALSCHNLLKEQHARRFAVHANSAHSDRGGCSSPDNPKQTCMSECVCNAVDVLSLCADVGACGVATHPWSVLSLAFEQSALHSHSAHGLPELVRVCRDGNSRSIVSQWAEREDRCGTRRIALHSCRDEYVKTTT
jgi:hypothetical protein